MITAEEIVLGFSNSPEQNNFSLGIVADLFENSTAKIKFDGEDVPSEKQYAYLASYVPEVEDRVLLGVLGGTYVILGKVNYDVSPDVEIEIDRYLFDLKKVIMEKGLSVTGNTEIEGGLAVSEGAEIVGDVSVGGDVTANNINSNGDINGVYINSSYLDVSSDGEFGGDLVARRTLRVNGTVTASNTFQHNGSNLGFYGRIAVARRSIAALNGTPDLAAMQNKINEFRTVLRAYGLLG